MCTKLFRVQDGALSEGRTSSGGGREGRFSSLGMCLERNLSCSEYSFAAVFAFPLIECLSNAMGVCEARRGLSPEKRVRNRLSACRARRRYMLAL